jgi:antitoxin component YwqK of YwqJK toxin-antitoxin module
MVNKLNKDYYENGNTRTEQTNSGLIIKYYYKNGNMAQDANFKNDMWHGTLKTFFENGIRAQIIQYKEDISNGFKIIFEYAN